MEDKMIEYKIQKLIEEYARLSNSPFVLREEIKKANEDISKKNAILNDIKSLEKRIKVLKKKGDHKEFLALNKKLREQINITKKESFYEYGLVDKETLGKILNIKKLREIGTGYTTIVFNDPINKDNILGFTLDETKIKWMQANKEKFDFQLIDTMPYTTGNDLYIYTAEKLNKTLENGKMSKPNRRIIYDDVVSKFKYLQEAKNFYGVTAKDLDYILYGIQNKEISDILKKLKNTFGDDEILDLHSNQWGENKKGEIILFDPIISRRTLNNVGDLNSLDLKTEFVFMLEKIFSKTNSSYLKKIKNFLIKK